MTIVAIDPGPVESAVLEWGFERLGFMGIMPNEQMRVWLASQLNPSDSTRLIAVEMIASYGMSVGKEVFETCLQIGRIQELSDRNNTPCRLVYRLQVKQHLCHDSRAKDTNIRAALIDRFGPPGTKKAPGVLYGIKSHLWAALAVAVYAADNPTS